MSLLDGISLVLTLFDSGSRFFCTRCGHKKSQVERLEPARCRICKEEFCHHCVAKLLENREKGMIFCPDCHSINSIDP